MSQPHPSDRAFLVLHTLRCIGFAGEDRVAAIAGLRTFETTTHLQALTVGGLVSHRPDPFGGWGLTELGRNEDAALASAELDAADAHVGVRESYEAFAAINQRLLDACHDWQMVQIGGTPVLNDHRDAAYDFREIDRLVKIDRSVQPIVARLSQRLARFQNYGRRMTATLDLVHAGDRAFFTDDIESYHSVWFHLHEDLLVTLGIERGSEGENRAAR